MFPIVEIIVNFYNIRFRACPAVHAFSNDAGNTFPSAEVSGKI